MWVAGEKARRELELADLLLNMTPFELMFHKTMGRQMTASEHRALDIADKALDEESEAA